MDLDTNVNQYLESFQIDDTWPDQPVTLRHIMTHTAGFEDGGVGYLIVDDPGRIMPLAEAMARYQPYRVNPPGAQTAYSNYATATDMLKFGLAILNGGEHNGGRILQPDTVDEMLRQQYSHDPRMPGGPRVLSD